MARTRPPEPAPTSSIRPGGAIRSSRRASVAAGHGQDGVAGSAEAAAGRTVGAAVGGGEGLVGRPGIGGWRRRTAAQTVRPRQALVGRSAGGAPHQAQVGEGARRCRSTSSAWPRRYSCRRTLTDQSIHLSKLRVAAVQMNSTDDVAGNLAQADRLTREAAEAGAELVLLPEKWNVLGSGEHLRAGAEPLDGPAVTGRGRPPRELGIDLIAGSIVERLADSRAPREHERPRRADGRDRGDLPEDPHVRRPRRRGPLRRVRA